MLIRDFNSRGKGTYRGVDSSFSMRTGNTEAGKHGSVPGIGTEFVMLSVRVELTYVPHGHKYLYIYINMHTYTHTYVSVYPA